MSYDRIIRDALRLARAPRRFSVGGEADPKDISPSISNPISVFPKPQRMFPSDAPVPGGQYLGMPDKQDMTGHKSAVASIGVHPGGKPYFNASRDEVDQTGTAGKAKTKTNLFKQKAGWSWQTAPEGHEDTNTIVSVEHRGKHYYTLNAHFPKGVDFARYAESRSEPRLRPTTTGDVFLGPQAGTISVRGKEHPVYHHVVVKADGGAVGYASGGDVDQPRKLDDMGFYSSAAESARSLPQSKGTPQQMLATMKGVKPAELQWSGVQDKFADQKSVSKEDLAQHFEDNVPNIKETVLGGRIDPKILKRREEIKNLYWPDIKRFDLISDTHREDYIRRNATMRSNEIREVMNLHMDEEAPIPDNLKPTQYKDYTVGNRYGNVSPSQRGYREVLLHLPGEMKFKSGHWDDPNIVAHLRMQDRGPDNDILHLEELQSDWAQEGRDRGFKDKSAIKQYEDEIKKLREKAYKSIYQDAIAKGFSEISAKHFASNRSENMSHNELADLLLPPSDAFNDLVDLSNKYMDARYNLEPAPYVTNTDHWVELGLKRALLEAARGGYNKLVWTPGEEQAKRYSLSNYVRHLEYNPNNKSLEYIRVGHSDRALSAHPEPVNPEELPQVIGKEAAERLLATSPDRYGTHRLGGIDLKFGGEGMKSFYDKILPSALRRVLKPHTDKIQPTSHVVKGNDGEDVTLPGIEITPEMRESILKKGFSYYARGGEVRQHFEDGGGADGGDSGGGDGGDGYGGNDASPPDASPPDASPPDSTQDSPAFNTDAPDNVNIDTGYSATDENAPPPDVTQQSPYSHFEGVPVLESVEKSITTGPGLVGAIAPQPFGALATIAEAINNAYYDGKARADIDPNAGGAGSNEQPQFQQTPIYDVQQNPVVNKALDVTAPKEQFTVNESLTKPSIVEAPAPAPAPAPTPAPAPAPEPQFFAPAPAPASISTPTTASSSQPFPNAAPELEEPAPVPSQPQPTSSLASVPPVIYPSDADGSGGGAGSLFNKADEEDPQKLIQAFSIGKPKIPTMMASGGVVDDGESENKTANNKNIGHALSDKETENLVGKIQSVLTPDLLEPKYRKQSEGQHPTFGHCASATQAAYYMLGGKESGYVPQVAKEDDGTTHWWLRHRQTGHVIDPTKEQYTSQGNKPPYDRGRGCGFPNPNPDAPSRRGQEIIDRISGKPFRQAKASGGPVENQDIASPAPAEDEGITTYHGSPHEFERFDISKIGTGEGAQAYGHGLYLAEHEPIAKSYRDALARDPRDAVNRAIKNIINSGDPATQDNLMFELRRHKELDEYQNDSNFKKDLIAVINGTNSDNTLTDNAMQAIRRIDKLLPPKSQGYMYEVRIKAHPDHFLDWDKPISKQSKKVQAVLRDMFKDAKKSFEQIDLSGDPTGGQVHHLYSQHRGGNNKSVSEYLLQNGIPGIKYLDAASRSAGTGPFAYFRGTHNYVVFDDKLLDIKRRYEMGGAVPMASGGEVEDTQPMPNQLTSEQQSLLDQLSRAIDRVYPAMDAAEVRQPVIRDEPTMPGEPALTREQHQEYNIGQLQNALARIPTDYPANPAGYAKGGRTIKKVKIKKLNRANGKLSPFNSSMVSRALMLTSKKA